MDLPQGFFEAPPGSAPPPPQGGELPTGFSSSPPGEAPATLAGGPQPETNASPPPTPPAGFFLSPPPPGFSDDNPVVPAQKPSPVAEQKTNTQVPGFWETAANYFGGDDPLRRQYIEALTRPYQNTPGTALGKGVQERTEADIQGAQAILPQAAGGKTLEQFYQEDKTRPQDEIDRLLQQKVTEGWSDPKWWGAQIAHGAGSMVPGAGAAIAGSAVGIPAPVGFGAEAMLGTVVPAYKAARAAGLDPEAATKRALIDSGIAAAGATAMGIAPGISFFGRAPTEAAVDQVANTFKRPVLEALTQLGFVQPAIATGAHEITALTHGEQPGTDDLLTTYVTGAAMGLVPVGAHAALRGLTGGTPSASGAPPATPDEISRSFENQAPPGAGQGGTPLGPENPASISALEDEPQRRLEAVFYSPVKEAIEKKLPESASVQQVLSTLRNTPGVKEEELADLQLPSYLAGLDGKVNKTDLLEHVEANALRLEEVQAGEATNPMIQEARRLSDLENGPGSWNRIGGGGQEHYIRDARRLAQRQLDTVRQTLTEKNGTSRDQFWPAEDQDALTQAERDFVDYVQGGRGSFYEKQVTPGPHDNYREFMLKVPPRGEKEVPEIDPNSPRGWQVIGEGPLEPRYRETTNFLGGHFTDLVNVLAHFRTTDRTDVNGRRLLHVEEIQSDLHQQGRKRGYRSKESIDLTPQEAENRLNAARMKYEQVRDQAMREFPKLDVRQDPYVTALRDRWHNAMQDLQQATAEREKLPDLPMKSGWQELAVKRILRLAADEGYEGISWNNGDQVGLRIDSPEQLAGNREFYDKKLPSLFGKWAKKLGMESGTTKLWGANPETYMARFTREDARRARQTKLREAGLFDKPFNERNGYIEVNPAAGSRVRMGLPLYEDEPQGKGTRTINEIVTKGLPEQLIQAGLRIGKIVDGFAREMGISKPVKLIMGPNRARWRGRAQLENGRYTIRINTNRLRTPEDFYATAAHELGHVIMWDKFAGENDQFKTQVFNAFSQFRQQISATARTVGDVRRLRDNAVSEVTGARNLPDRANPGGMQNDIPLSDLTPRSRAYIMHFEEWFAEQVARWATTSDKPLNRVEKFFKGLADKVRSIIAKFTGMRKDSPEAIPAIQQWLDSMLTQMDPWAGDIKDKMEFDTKRQNQAAVDRDGTPEVTVPPQTASTGGGRNILNALGNAVGPAGAATAAHADRMNRFYEWMTSLPQIAEMNKHIRGLQLYKEIVSLMNLEKNNIMGDAWETLRSWKALADPKQLVALNKFIEDYANGFFKDPSIPDGGEIRRPTKAEFGALAQKHGLTGQALRVFDRLVRDFDGFLENYRQLLLADATKIKDPDRQFKAIEDANTRVDNLLKRPYFPLVRFGKYTITVYDSEGNVKHFEQTDSLKRQALVAKALEKSHDLLPGDRVRTGEVPKDAAPLLGMPPGFIDLVADKLNLSSTQRQMLDQLRFDYAPSQSFRHQFKQKDVTPGYSTDFQRAYAHFFFHGANHFTRVKWVDALRDQIREVKKDSILLNDANKRDQIANYMTEHLKMLVDPKPDFAALRGLMFHWFLGFNPASATLNLSQTPIMTYPHLASKFGDIRSVAAILRAGSQLENFYKKGTLKELSQNAPPGPAGAPIRALSEAVKEGVVSETQAHTLAAVSEDRNLLRAFGSRGEEFWQKFNNASSWMFEMTEQYNRRVTFRAAWDLAMRSPNAKYVQETVRDNPLQYKRLRDSGWSHQEAAAFTAAKDSVEKTQFVYAPYARPKLMWGRKGALFIFKNFTQNTLFRLWSNPQMAARSLLIMGGLGGLMGLPGMEDVNGILKALAWRLFGKDFDLEDQARQLAIDTLNGTINPDLLLHGTSVHGFGIPHVLNSLGAHVGLPEKWFPTLDRSKSTGMGNILPIEPGKLFGPAKDIKGQEIAQLQRASGAGFGNAFALYQFLTSEQSLGDLKRWELIMPKALSNVSHSFRFLHEGMERNRVGNAVVKFDPTDTEQMAEILARAAGYQPRRLTGRWEQIEAQTEAATYWDLRKGILLRQFGEAIKSNSPEDKARVLQAVKNYNSELPQEAKAKAITALALKDSVRQRMKVQAAQQAGLPTQKSNIPLARSMDKYFPDGRPTGQVDARPVK